MTGEAGGEPGQCPPGEGEEKRREEPPVREGRSPGNVGSERAGLDGETPEGGLGAGALFPADADFKPGLVSSRPPGALKAKAAWM